jgi:class 3 adenylate cyclase
LRAGLIDPAIAAHNGRIVKTTGDGLLVEFSVAGVIEPALQAAEMRRSIARPTTDLTAHDLYLRALATICRRLPGRRSAK